MNNLLTTQAFVSSPLEQFETVSFISINSPEFGSFNFAFTNIVLYSGLTVFIILGLHLAGNNDTKLVPNNWSIALESSYASVQNIVRGQIGQNNEIYFPFIYSLFFFVLIGNLISNVPYSYAITSSAVVTLGLSVSIFLGVTILGLYKHRLHFFSFFVPAGCPIALVPLLALIELISYVARAFSLGVRLFANIVSGHTLLAILSGLLSKLFTAGLLVATFTLIPFAIFSALVVLEIAVSLIQAFVFCLLTSSYLKDSISLH